MPDFGAGLSVDELIGVSAAQISVLRLPADKVFQQALQAARRMVKTGLGSHLLVELWEDNHSVWNDPNNGLPVVVSPDGSITRSQSN